MRFLHDDSLHVAKIGGILQIRNNRNVFVTSENNPAEAGCEGGLHVWWPVVDKEDSGTRKRHPLGSRGEQPRIIFEQCLLSRDYEGIKEPDEVVPPVMLDE